MNGTRNKIPAHVRFWAKVDKSAGPDGCWVWTAATQRPFGYGVFHSSKGRTVRAHRFSLELHLQRPVKPGMFVCHACDNPPCVNPAHLREGTNADNVQDAVKRQRQKRGQMDPHAKLTPEDVLNIRIAVAEGELSRSVATQYGVQESLISGIVRGTRWRHVGGPLTYHYKTKRKAS